MEPEHEVAALVARIAADEDGVDVRVTLEDSRERGCEHLDALPAFEAAEEHEVAQRQRHRRRTRAGGADRLDLDRVRHHREAVFAQSPVRRDAVEDRLCRAEDEGASSGLIALERANEPGPRVERSPVQLVQHVGRCRETGDDGSLSKARDPPGLGFPFRCVHEVRSKAVDGPCDRAQGK